MNLWDILILFVLVGAAVLALRGRRRARKNGSGCCSGGCEHCAGCAPTDGPE